VRLSSRLTFGLIGLVLLFAPGCGPEVPKEDLGKMIYEVPKVPGAEKTVELPELDRPPAAATPSAPDAAKPHSTPAGSRDDKRD
jgi:hypothetical protein